MVSTTTTTMRAIVQDGYGAIDVLRPDHIARPEPGADEVLVRKPANLSFEEAAVVPISGVTALEALTVGRVSPGQHVLVIGASGGVGSYAVQLAKAFGSEVTGVASTSKLDLVRALGADHVIDYQREDFAGARIATT